MDRQTLIQTLRAHEAELRRAGVQSLSLFGSAARGDAGPDSDVDVGVRLSADFTQGGFKYVGRLEDLRERPGTDRRPRCRPRRRNPSRTGAPTAQHLTEAIGCLPFVRQGPVAGLVDIV